MLLKATIILSIIYIASVGATCPHILHHLADLQSALIHCITWHAVPVTMCISCRSNYTDLLKIYDSLATNCSNLYFDKDRINIVASTQIMLTGLWTKAFCDDCFNNNNLFEFAKKNTDFYDCLQTFKNKSCTGCKIQYMDLNNFYINLDQHNNGEVCYDLQDSMNRTRDKWSKELNCCRREKDTTIFTITLCIISFLPMLFYGSTYLITKRQERNHGVLNDDEPIYNSELPSTSRQYNNDINNSTQPMTANSFSSSKEDVNNLSTTKTLKPVHKKGYSNEDPESSDDDIRDVAVNTNKLNIFK